MILLTNGDDIEVLLGAGPDLGCVASWTDLNGTTATPGRTTSNATASNASQIVPGPAAATYRTVKDILIHNAITNVASQTVGVQVFDGATQVNYAYAVLAPGETFQYAEGTGWRKLSAAGNEVLAATSSPDPRENGFRLSGVSATPVMTSDSTTLNTIYLTAFRGNRMALWNGSQWVVATDGGSEKSYALSGRTTDLPFDIWAYLDSTGQIALEVLDWTNATTRATGWTWLNGVRVKTGDSTRRLLGSCRPRSATTFHWVRTGTDLPVKFDLFNIDNRMAVDFKLIATTNTWAYTTATIRQAQGSTNYQVDVMVGVQEECLYAELVTSSRNSTISIPRHAGVGYDTTTAFTGLSGSTANTVASIEACQVSPIAHSPAIGRHFYSWNEISTATGTCTWVGDDGALRLQSGMTGRWIC